MITNDLDYISVPRLAEGDYRIQNPINAWPGAGTEVIIYVSSFGRGQITQTGVSVTDATDARWQRTRQRDGRWTQWQDVSAGGGAADYVLKAGDTMEGPLVLDGAPTTDLDASTKKYVDDAIAAAIAGLPFMTQAQADVRYLQQAQADQRYLRLAGGAMTGPLDLVATPPASMEAALSVSYGVVEIDLANGSTLGSVSIPGIYRPAVPYVPADTPIGVPASAWSLVVQASGTNVWQTFFAGPDQYVRHAPDGTTWSTWRQVTMV